MGHSFGLFFISWLVLFPVFAGGRLEEMWGGGEKKESCTSTPALLASPTTFTQEVSLAATMFPACC